MKLFTTVLSLSLTLSAFAGVKEDVVALGKLGNGYNVQSAKGKTAEALFKNWVEAQNGEAEPLVFKEYKDMDFADETDYGFTSTKSAIDMGMFYESALEDDLEHADDSDEAKLKSELAAIKKGWAPLIQKLDRQGVKFGYTGWGPGYCGVSFVELIIVDPKEQKVYEVYISTSGQC